MDSLNKVFDPLMRALFAPGLPSERLFIVYVVSAIVIAYVLYRVRKPAVGFLRYCFPKEVFLHRSAKQDYLFYFWLALIKGALVALPLAWLGANLSEFWSTTTGATDTPEYGFFEMAAFSVLILLAFDFGIFFSHYLQHKVPILWEFHKVHHSAEVLTPITVFRASPVDLLVTGGLVILCEGAARLLWLSVIGSAPGVVAILGINGGIFLFYIFGYNLRHSHIWLSYPTWLSGLLVSPAMHQIHHSSEERHLDKNMGFIFSWWDKLFGTLYVPKEREDFRLGLYGEVNNPFESSHEMIWKPFVWAGRRIGRNVRKVMSLFALTGLVVLGHAQDLEAASSKELRSLHLEELTWTEVREALDAGYRQVIIPTGGVEQNGPHVVLGKHNIVVRHAAEEIARRLGNTMVAPVVTYVPEGQIDPPSGHMRFPGTISISEETFQEILSRTAESLLQHGFTRVYLIGDSGGNQASQSKVADSIGSSWWGGQPDPQQVFHIGDYYFPERNGQIEWLKQAGYSMEQIGTHAGIRDTSEVLALRPEGVRVGNQVLPGQLDQSGETGVIGDPSLASGEYGKKMLELKIEAALRQIRSLDKL
ncbi:MAG: creatininase family protein [Roseibium sp.]|uniref:creatininase family protein n=3 Tax=Roseibium sp. TaxID=1936156 RepID=UPI001B1DE766|nr:creatininase family protein [Roseibium sp.]MBO6893507.1 creatininase family protein [Roseibium sp.]